MHPSGCTPLLREALTSATLAARHPTPYGALFARAPTVVSVPLGVSLTGDRALTSRRATAILQLPRRVLVGIEAGEGDGTLATALEYDAASGEFVPSPTTLTERLARVVRDASGGRGGRFHVLCEGQDGRNLAVPAALAVAISLSQRISDGRIDTSAFDRWRCEDPAALLATPLFHEVLDEGVLLQRALRPGAPTGGSVISCALPSPAHLLAFGGSRPGVRTPRELGHLPDAANHWPVDVALIGTGTRNDLGLDPETALDDADFAASIAEYRGSFPAELPLCAPLVGDVRSAVDALRDRAFLAVFRGWVELWKHAGALRTVDALLEAYNRREALLWATEVLHPCVHATLRELRATLGRGRYGAFPLGTGIHGGSVLVVTPAGEAREAIETVPDELRRTGCSGACLEYLSWRDASLTHGPVLEQHLPSGVLHPSLPRSARRVTRYSAAGTRTWLEAAGDSRDLADISIDVDAARLTIAGRPVTSRDLPSQCSTAELLTRLLRSPTRTIANDALPRSSYRTARNELTSKLVTPLLRTLSARTGKELRIRTCGSSDRFSITLGLVDATVDVEAPLTPPPHGTRPRLGRPS